MRNWYLILQQPESKQYSFRFFLDFPNGAVQNDVQLPAEDIYFLSSCWIFDNDNSEALLDRAWQQRIEILDKLKSTNEELVNLGSKVCNIFQKALNLRETTLLMDKRNKLENQLRDMDQSWPIRDDLGIVNGPKSGMIFPEEGCIAVKWYRGVFEDQEQYHWVGTFWYEIFSFKLWMLMNIYVFEKEKKSLFHSSLFLYVLIVYNQCQFTMWNQKSRWLNSIVVYTFALESITIMQLPPFFWHFLFKK